MYEDELGWTLDYDAGIMAGGGDFTKAFHAAQTGQRCNRCPPNHIRPVPAAHHNPRIVWLCSRHALPALGEEWARELLHRMRQLRRRQRGPVKWRVAACLWGCCLFLLAAEVAGNSVEAKTALIAQQWIKVLTRICCVTPLFDLMCAKCWIPAHVRYCSR
jgi:hypothetical protein